LDDESDAHVWCQKTESADDRRCWMT
jgi:hypothetical protein